MQIHRMLPLLTILVLFVGCPSNDDDTASGGDDDTTAADDDTTTAGDDDSTPTDDDSTPTDDDTTAAGDDDSQGSPCGEDEYECGDDDTADGCWYAEYTGTTHIEIDLADGTHLSEDCPTTASLSKHCSSFVGTVECPGKSVSTLTFSGDIDQDCGPLTGDLEGAGPVDCTWAGGVSETYVHAEFLEASPDFCVHGDIDLEAVR